MRILIAGAGGVVGRALIPRLTAVRHQVFGTTPSPDRAALIGSLGAEPIVADALDSEAVLRAVQLAKPDAIIHQLTALPRKIDIRHFDRDLSLTNLLRTKGTDHLIRAAQAVGVRRIVAQSFCGWSYGREGSWVKKEEDSLDSHPALPFHQGLEAIQYLEHTVLNSPNIEGIALRYGFFYGPVSSTGGVGEMVADVRARRLPLVGQGTGVWSFVHIEDVASATQAAVEQGRPGVYNVVDDEPAPVSVWLPELARILGAKPPFRVPEWIARVVIGEAGMILMTQIRGASNTKAKKQLAWQPRWPSWRQGFINAFQRPGG